MKGSTHLCVVERVYTDLGHDVAGQEVPDLAEWVVLRELELRDRIQAVVFAYTSRLVHPG